MKSGILCNYDGMSSFTKFLMGLPKHDVLVGIPEDKAQREDQEPITNAAIGYISEFGAPERNIPARPWLIPGIHAWKVKITSYMKQAAQLALAGKYDACNRALAAAGLSGQIAAQKKINEGIPPALAESTLKARARRRGKGTGVSLAKGAAAELARREAGGAPGTDLAKPLVDTAQFLKSVSYTVRGGR